MEIVNINNAESIAVGWWLSSPGGIDLYADISFPTSREWLLLEEANQIWKSLDRSVFSEQLKTLRKAKGITQVELFEKSGIDQSDISRFENGMQQPTLDTALRLARALDVSPFQLFMRANTLLNSVGCDNKPNPIDKVRR